MRIISGRFARKNINAPTNLPVRPTTDFAKTGLFNILSNRINFTEVNALDLFAGTGNIGYELFSRGTEEITCVDQSPECTRFINETFRILHAEKTTIIKEDVLDFLNRTKKTFDLIFADPPYEFKLHHVLIEIIFKKKLIRNNGLFVLEHGSVSNFSENEFFSEERKYGNVHFSFFKS